MPTSLCGRPSTRQAEMVAEHRRLCHIVLNIQAPFQLVNSLSPPSYPTMLPRIILDDSERTHEQRPTLPAIRDLFGEHLGKNSLPSAFSTSRSTPFSLTDLGSSLPADSRPTSPDSWQARWNPPGSAQWSRASGHRDPASGQQLERYFARRHSDASTSPPTSSAQDQFITLPPIQQPYLINSRGASGDIAAVLRITSPRRAFESHSRTRSTPAAIEGKGGHVPSYVLSKRRHTIASARGPSPVRFPYDVEHISRPTAHLPSRPPSAVGSPYSRRASLTSPYPSPSPSTRTLSPAMDSSQRLSESSTSGEDAPTERRKTPAKYQCQYCGKRFNRPSSLKIHHNTHTGEKPFACLFPGCGRHFSVMSNMRRHARIHGETLSQYSCEGSEEILDLPPPSYSSASSTQTTPIISHIHPPSASPSPHFRSSSRLQSSSRHENSKSFHSYATSPPPSSDDEGSFSLEL